jgi:hypothetical protein
VKIKEYTEVILDSNGDPVMEGEYAVKVKVVKMEPEYYRWQNGQLTMDNCRSVHA